MESTRLPTTTSNSLNTSLTQSLVFDFHHAYAELCQIFQCTGANGQTNPGLYPTPLTLRQLHTTCPLKHIWLQFLFLVMPDKSWTADIKIQRNTWKTIFFLLKHCSPGPPRNNNYCSSQPVIIPLNKMDYFEISGAWEVPLLPCVQVRMCQFCLAIYYLMSLLLAFRISTVPAARRQSRPYTFRLLLKEINNLKKSPR